MVMNIFHWDLKWSQDVLLLLLENYKHDVHGYAVITTSFMYKWIYVCKTLIVLCSYQPQILSAQHKGYDKKLTFFMTLMIFL